MINLLKQNMISRSDIFNDIFEFFLSSINYVETSLILERLDKENEVFPNIPTMQVTWFNKSNNQLFVFSMYNNYVTDFIIKNGNNGKSISINDFKRNKKNCEIEMYLLEGEINIKYKLYLIKILELIKTTELLDVLEGKIWFDVPYDWQNQK